MNKIDELEAGFSARWFSTDLISRPMETTRMVAASMRGLGGVKFFDNGSGGVAGLGRGGSRNQVFSDEDSYEFFFLIWCDGAGQIGEEGVGFWIVAMAVLNLSARA